LNWTLGQQIFSVGIAGLSVLASLTLLVPSLGTFSVWAIDIFLSLAWFAVFGIVVRWLRIEDGCGARVYDLSKVAKTTFCGRWRTAEAFAFISAVAWLLSGILGTSVVRWRKDKQQNKKKGSGGASAA
jgi:hypothetical protein